MSLVMLALAIFLQWGGRREATGRAAVHPSIPAEPGSAFSYLDRTGGTQAGTPYVRPLTYSAKLCFPGTVLAKNWKVRNKGSWRNPRKEQRKNEEYLTQGHSQFVEKLMMSRIPGLHQPGKSMFLSQQRPCESGAVSCPRLPSHHSTTTHVQGHVSQTLQPTRVILWINTALVLLATSSLSFATLDYQQNTPKTAKKA